MRRIIPRAHYIQCLGEYTCASLIYYKTQLDQFYNDLNPLWSEPPNTKTSTKRTTQGMNTSRAQASSSARTPGSGFPSRSSKQALLPVEMWLVRKTNLLYCCNRVTSNYCHHPLATKVCQFLCNGLFTKNKTNPQVIAQRLMQMLDIEQSTRILISLSTVHPYSLSACQAHNEPDIPGSKTPTKGFSST